MNSTPKRSSGEPLLLKKRNYSSFGSGESHLGVCGADMLLVLLHYILGTKSYLVKLTQTTEKPKPVQMRRASHIFYAFLCRLGKCV